MCLTVNDGHLDFQISQRAGVGNDSSAIGSAKNSYKARRADITLQYLFSFVQRTLLKCNSVCHTVREN